jgi:threonine/homoserine/homoserine lactone efflux protein
MVYLWLFGISLVVGLSGAVMPGPLLTVTINETYRRGFIAAPLLVAGHAVLEGALLILLALGLDAIITKPLAFGIIGTAGGAVLLWMGTSMILEERDRSLHLDLERHEGKATGPFLAGLTTSVSNPYWILWWATFGLAWLSKALEHGAGGVAAFYLGHISADVIWYFFVALLVVTGKRFLSDRVYRWIIIGCGTFLLMLGARFIGDGLFTLVKLAT